MIAVSTSYGKLRPAMGCRLAVVLEVGSDLELAENIICLAEPGLRVPGPKL
jgi:hypothetical protein